MSWLLRGESLRQHTAEDHQLQPHPHPLGAKFDSLGQLAPRMASPAMEDIEIIPHTVSALQQEQSSERLCSSFQLAIRFLSSDSECIWS